MIKIEKYIGLGNYYYIIMNTKLTDIEADYKTDQREDEHLINNVKIRNKEIIVEYDDNVISVDITSLKTKSLDDKIKNKIGDYYTSDTIKTKIERIDKTISKYKTRNNNLKLEYLVNDDVEGFGLRMLDKNIIIYKIIEDDKLVSEAFFDKHPNITKENSTDVLKEKVIYENNKIYIIQGLKNSIKNFKINNKNIKTYMVSIPVLMFINFIAFILLYLYTGFNDSLLSFVLMIYISPLIISVFTTLLLNGIRNRYIILKFFN